MKFATFAEVLTPNHPRAKQGASGFRLKDILDENHGEYKVAFEFSDHSRKLAKKITRAASNEAISETATASSIWISLEHLRGYDPDNTWIIYGIRYIREEGDGSFDEELERP